MKSWEVEALQDQFKAILNKFGAGSVADYVLSNILPRISIWGAKVDEDSLPLGASKYGGRPDLPLDIPWPRYAEHSMTFLLQLNLADVTALDEEKLLPETGILYLFMLDPIGNFSMLYYAGEMGELVRRTPPTDFYRFSTLPTSRLSYEKGITIPTGYDRPNPLLDLLDSLDADPDVDYEDIFDPFDVETALANNYCQYHGLPLYQYRRLGLRYVGQLLGHVFVQTDLAQAKGLRALLDLDSDEANDLIFGDVGQWTFWIRPDDLAKRDFTKMEGSYEGG